MNNKQNQDRNIKIDVRLDEEAELKKEVVVRKF